MAISTNVKVNAQSRAANPPAAYYPIASTDWGVLAPGATGTAFANGNLTNVGSGGSLANGSFFAKITWVTAIGESTASAEGTVTVTGGPSGSVTIALGSVGAQNTGAQANAQPILGWRIYTSSTTGTEVANEAAASLSVTLSSLTTQRGGTLLYIPIATTSATVKVLGAGAALPAVNTSGIQLAPLPAVSSNATSDLLVKVPATFYTNKATQWKIPNETASAAGTALVQADCVAPIWPQSASASAGDLIVINGILFQCTTAGTTGSSAPNFAASTLYGTVTDNTATWTNLGRWRAVRLRFMNLSGSAAQPTAQEYDLFQM